MKSFKNRHIIAKLCQVACTGKTCRAGTDNGNLLALLLSRCFRYESMLSGPVSNETLQLSDGNCLSLDAADTLSFTLTLLRADTAADCRKSRGLRNRVGCANVIFLFYLADKCRNINFYGTSVYTAGVFAV